MVLVSNLIAPFCLRTSCFGIVEGTVERLESFLFVDYGVPSRFVAGAVRGAVR